MLKIKPKNTNQPSNIDTLIIIGNGFDIWQGANTSYREFEKYYHANRKQILRKLGLSEYKIPQKDSKPSETFSDVELIYGTPFKPQKLEDGFWHNFEDSLRHLDIEQLNLFFGKDDDGLYDMEMAVENAQAILREAFCGWISTITIAENKSEFNFIDNCLFINFNYTDTLEKRFGIPDENVFHIHGKADQKNSIIFGHSIHPQLPIEELNDFGGRFRGLYLAERLLFETDKHSYIHYLELLVFLASRGVKLADIKNIHVLGHSFGSADFEYFEELASVFSGEETPKSTVDFSSIDATDALHLMIGYVILTYGNDGPHPEFDRGTTQAFAQWVYQSQKNAMWDSIKKQYRRRFLSRHKHPNRLRKLEEVVAIPHNASTPKWHISYHSEEDRLHIENTMHTIGISNYKLYSTIDECIAPLENKKVH